MKTHTHQTAPAPFIADPDRVRRRRGQIRMTDYLKAGSVTQRNVVGA
jgi:hypothetical protein